MPTRVALKAIVRDGEKVIRAAFVITDRERFFEGMLNSWTNPNLTVAKHQFPHGPNEAHPQPWLPSAVELAVEVSGSSMLPSHGVRRMAGRTAKHATNVRGERHFVLGLEQRFGAAANTRNERSEEAVLSALVPEGARSGWHHKQARQISHFLLSYPILDGLTSPLFASLRRTHPRLFDHLRERDPCY